MAVIAVDGWMLYVLDQGEMQHFEVEQDAIDRAEWVIENSSPSPLMIIPGKIYKHVEE